MPKSKKASRAARFYDEYHQASDRQPADHPWRRKTHRIFRGMLRALDPAPGGRFLDLSCGLGYFLLAAREHDPTLRLEGLDHSAYAVREARARVPEARVRRGDALKQPYPDGRFDAVACIGSLEHYADPEQGLSEIHRVLKPGGKALIYVPNLFFVGYIALVWRSGETPHEAGQNEYERFETRQGWEDMLKRQGFRIAKVTRHNEMFATERVPRPVVWLYTWFIERWVPLNLSYCFGFHVVKDAQPAARPR